MQQKEDINDLKNKALNALDAQEKAEPAVEKSTYSFEELWALKDVQQRFLIPELLPVAAMAVLIGEDGIGKTQICTQLCLNIALERDEFLGLKLHAPLKSAIIVATEDSKEKFSKSLTKQAQAMEMNINPKKVNIRFTEGSNFDDLEGLIHELERLLKECNVELIIMDAVSDLFTLIDGEINSNSHARKILNRFQKIINTYGVTILFIHHAAKTKIVEKQKNGKLFVEKGDSQGAGALTQKPRTILALTHDPSSIKNEGMTYTNYLHVVKANLMSKMYVTHAIELEFDASCLIHTAKGLIDIQLMENPDKENVSASPMKKDLPVDIPEAEHLKIVGEVFPSGTEQFKRSDFIGILAKFYKVGKNKIESNNGILQHLLDRGFIRNFQGVFSKEEYQPIIMPTMNLDITNISKEQDDEEVPF